jgi:NitT/TauT family transport system permease protein
MAPVARVANVRRRRKALDSVLLAMAVLAAWQVLFWLVGDSALASPRETLARLGELLQTARFWDDVAETLQAVAVAVSIAVAAGVSFGIVLGSHQRSGDVAEPLLVTLYSLPKVTLYPVVLLIFGLGISARVAFGIIHGIFPVVLFSMAAIRNIQPVIWRSAQAFHLSKWQTVTSVILPAALPGIMIGVRIGTSVTLLGVLVGEMFAAKRGVGYRLMNAIGNHDVATILAIALALSLFALAVNALLTLLGRRATGRERGIERA